MCSKVSKSLLLFLVGMSGSNLTVAAPTSVNPAGPTNAIAFAIQAGQIAGTAQACGINITTFTTRANEAINKLALNPTDSTAATNSYQQALQQAQLAQNKNHSLPCSEVNQDFNSLPLMRPDYEQSVIAQLNPDMTDNNTPTNAPNAPTASNNAASPNNNNVPNNYNSSASAMPNQQNLNNQQMPNTGATNANSNTNNAVANNNSNNQDARNSNSTGGSNFGSSNNSTYSQQNYGPLKSPNNAYSGAIQPYGMNNIQPQQQMVTANQSNNYANNSNPGTNNNNPPPPSFSNPNNAPQANNAYPSR